MQDGHEPRMTTGPGSFNNKAPWIIMPFGSRAMDAVRTRKLPFSLTPSQESSGPWQVGCMGGEQRKAQRTGMSGLEWRERSKYSPTLNSAYTMPALCWAGLPGAPRDGLPCPCSQGVSSHGHKPLELTTAYGKC